MNDASEVVANAIRNKTSSPCYQFSIDGEAYNNAIENVIAVLNEEFGLHLFYARDWSKIDRIAEKLGITFDENGEIINA